MYDRTLKNQNMSFEFSNYYSCVQDYKCVLMCQIHYMFI